MSEPTLPLRRREQRRALRPTCDSTAGTPTLAVAAALALALAGAGCSATTPFDDPSGLDRNRHIELDGADNFRDMGGYSTEDGRRVRWGKLFRSDDLTRLSPDDLEVLEALGIRMVCDFRSRRERKHEPDRLPRRRPNVEALEITMDDADPQTVRGRVLSGTLDEHDYRAVMTKGYRSFVAKHTPQFASLLRSLTDSTNIPALVHCTGGKDRAGFAAALVLRTLGVPKETVMADYLLTNNYTERKREHQLWLIWFASLFRVSPESARPLMRANPAYLDAAFAEIDTRYGSFDAYVENGLGLDETDVEHLRSMLLE